MEDFSFQRYMFPFNFFFLYNKCAYHLNSFSSPISILEEKELEIRIISDSVDTSVGYNTTYQHVTKCQISLWSI